MTNKEFEKVLNFVSSTVKKYRSNGYDGNALTNVIIGCITGGERTYTSAQLKQLFDLAWDKEDTD